MSNTITPAEHALIDAYLATYGAVQYPTGAMATIPEYIYAKGGGGKNDRIIRADGKNHWRQADDGFRSGRSRARRLAGAA